MSIYWIPVNSRGKLAIVARPRGGDWLRDDLQALSGAGMDALVSALTKEEQEELSLSQEPMTARECGMEFISFPINDRDVPENHASLRKLAMAIAEKVVVGKSVGVHCRAGIGRSSLIAAAILTELNVAPNQAFELISRSRGSLVPDTNEQRRWFESYAMARP